MNRQKKRPSAPKVSYYTLVVCGLVFLLIILMIVPVSVSLSAGIAALSVVIFGIGLTICGALWFIRPKSERRYIAAAFIAAGFGLSMPQIVFVVTADKYDAKLRFDLVQYMTFSGKTTLPPDRLIAYKSDRGRPMHVAMYKSDKSGQRPAVVLLHGGGWRYGNHLETGKWPQVLTEAGFHVFSVEYRKSNDTYQTWRDAPGDVHSAVDYVLNHSSELSVDSTRVHLMGQSAGGHLALLEAYLYDQAASVVSLYAPIDLVLDYHTSRDKSAELDFLGGPPSQYANRYLSVSPITYATNNAPRSLLVQGTTDDLVSPRNAIQLSQVLSEKNVEHEVILLPMTGHSFENQRGGFATQITEQSVVRFLSQ